MSRFRISNDLVWADEEHEEEEDKGPKMCTLPWLVHSKLLVKQPLVPMQLYSGKELHGNTAHKEFLQAKYGVISAEYLFGKLYKQCVWIQLDVFGYDDAEYKCELEKWTKSRRYRKHNKKPTKRPNSYMYTNNYVIFIDTVFRMIALFDRYIKDLSKYKCSIDNIVLINDINWTSIPRCHEVWNFASKTFCTRERIAANMIKQLKLISQTFKPDELDEFETFNSYLMKTFPELYHFDYYHPNFVTMCVTREGKEKLRKDFMYLAALLQVQLTMKEIYLAWTMVFDILSRRKGIHAFTMVEQWGKRNRPQILLEPVNTSYNKFVNGKWESLKDRHANKIDNTTIMNALCDWRRFKCKYEDVTPTYKVELFKVPSIKRAATPAAKRCVIKRVPKMNKRAETPKHVKLPNRKYKQYHYRCTSDVFNFNIIHIFNKEKCLFFTRKFVPYDNVFYFRKTRAHYPISARKYSNCVLDTSTMLVRYKPHNKTLLSCFDDINKECAERILDMNDSLRVMLFDDLKTLYLHDSVGADVIRPDSFNEQDYFWLTKEMVCEFLPDVITRYNKIFKTEVL